MTEALDPQKLDDRVARMLDVYANERFDRPRTAGLLRLRLVLWVIRNRIAGGLKRALDVTGAAVALVLLSPVMAATALAIVIDDPGPVFYRQVRVGKWGRTFRCFKFRSMYVNADQMKKELIEQNEADGPVFKIKNDPRITRVGRFIRKFSIDELPQLINVLRGEMSLVGPRPPLPSETDQYALHQRRRLDAVPGITGLQQVSGRSDLDFHTWVELDLQYIAEQSFWKDLLILLKTIPAIVSGKGAY